MSTGTFDKQVQDITRRTQERLLAAVKNTIRKVVEQAQTPIRKGGKMRVDTGFMRWSGTAALNEMPAGLRKGRIRKKNEEGVLPEYAMTDEGGKMLNSSLIDMKIGDTFYFGWTAEYAPYWEMKDGFMISAVNNFNLYLNDEIRRLK